MRQWRWRKEESAALLSSLCPPPRVGRHLTVALCRAGAILQRSLRTPRVGKRYVRSDANVTANMEPLSRFQFTAFLSYSHAADGRLAEVLQSKLQRFATPWYRRRSIRVFRDTTGLGLTPDLWDAIRVALTASEFFILLASEQAARSQWVSQET